MNKLRLGIVVICFIVVALPVPAGCGPSASSATPAPQQTPERASESKPPSIVDNRNSLFIPPILEDKDASPSNASLELMAVKSTKEFFPGEKTETYGYNGDYLGPTIKVNKGEHVTIKVKNSLPEETTVHWHGLLIDGEMDGGPHQMILSGNEWSPDFVINQPAATLWYHAHPIHKTGSQVYKGLAGLFIIDDEEAEKLNLPDNYGVNDIPLIVQDRRFTENGTLVYKTNMMDVMQGMLGNTILV